jgi:hypothetical protein
VLSALPIIFLATNAPLPAAVSVDTSRVEAAGWKGEEERQLRGSLLARLLEQGYRVAPAPKDAQIRLAVLKSGDGFVVEATGERRREYRIDPGPSAVVSLEILHRATMVVDEVRAPVPRPSADGETDRPLAKRSVSIEVTGPAEDVTASRLREELALAVSSSGFVLVPRSVPHERTVCVSIDVDEVTLATGAASSPCGAPAFKLARTTSRDELAAQVRGQISKLLPSDASPDTDTQPEPIGESTSRTKTKNAERVGNDRGWLLGLGADAGILSRVGGIDPLLQADVGFRRPSGLGARLLGSFTYSTGTATLGISETSIQIGPAFSFPLGAGFALRVGLVGGVRIHHYSYRATETGSRVGYDFALPAELTLDVGAPWVLGLAVLPGLTGPPRDHEVAGEIVWSRGLTYMGFTAGLGVVL